MRRMVRCGARRNSGGRQRGLCGDWKSSPAWLRRWVIQVRRCSNRLKPEAAAELHEITGKVINAEQMEIARLKAELAKTRMERDIERSGE